MDSKAMCVAAGFEWGGHAQTRSRPMVCYESVCECVKQKPTTNNFTAT